MPSARRIPSPEKPQILRSVQKNMEETENIRQSIKEKLLQTKNIKVTKGARNVNC